MEKVSLKGNEEQLPIQIFPDPLESAEEYSKGIKGRLPSIVIEPTDNSEVESGELRWPPEDFEDGGNNFEPVSEADSPLGTYPDPSEALPQGEMGEKGKAAVPNSPDGAVVVSSPHDSQEVSDGN
ncbi:protein LBH-like [Hypanus sabinus]|uniref:protein LBH-like n=1 Tax=Hypanus sabinus TaxID=79690 RepID=UPI0028C432D8|nr:protein LBH-like [Hypanus sabinus]XP_059814349.1 protein LBH-like [Hypanus sabinus]